MSPGTNHDRAAPNLVAGLSFPPHIHARALVTAGLRGGACGAARNRTVDSDMKRALFGTGMANQNAVPPGDNRAVLLRLDRDLTRAGILGIDAVFLRLDTAAGLQRNLDILSASRPNALSACIDQQALRG